jgi:hypothetical protein
LTARADALFELADAVLCADGTVTSLVELTLLAEHRRGHGGMYDALNQGEIEPERLRPTLATLPLPRGPPTGGSCSGSMSARGCARTPRPAPARLPQPPPRDQPRRQENVKRDRTITARLQCTG